MEQNQPASKNVPLFVGFVAGMLFGIPGLHATTGVPSPKGTVLGQMLHWLPSGGAGVGGYAADSSLLDTGSLITANVHIASAGAQPVVAAGTDSSAVSLTAGSTDTAGSVSSTAITLPAANANLVTVTFAVAYTSAPKMIHLQSTNASASGSQLYTQNITATSFQVYTRTAPGAGVVTTFSYFVVQ